MHKTKVCLSITLAILIVAGSFIYSLTVIEALAQAKGKVLAGEPSPSAKKLPRLVDVGADKCVPCVMMAPILEELKKEYAGIVEIEFVDVWKNPEAGRQYKIRVIPTQIFYDISGREAHENCNDVEDTVPLHGKFLP
jgi:thiol-disulfide isomerase/thioredoxin